jgi:hypothetical protein
VVVHAGGMGYFKRCRLARMSDNHYCLIRDLGLVKGGKGMRHHEVLIAFNLRGLVRIAKRIRDVTSKRGRTVIAGAAQTDGNV